MELYRFFKRDMFSVKAVSERFGIPKGRVYDYIRRGKIKALRNPLGPGLLIPEEELPKLQALGEFYEAKKKGEVSL